MNIGSGFLRAACEAALSDKSLASALLPIAGKSPLVLTVDGNIEALYCVLKLLLALKCGLSLVSSTLIYF